MMARLALGACLMLATTVGSLADVVGHYKIEGKNPEGSADYTGTVDVKKTGDTYQIIWHVDGGDKFVGTAIGDDTFLSSAYKSGDNTGLALYVKKGDAWEGIWTYAGGRKLGTEKWTAE